MHTPTHTQACSCTHSLTHSLSTCLICHMLFQKNSSSFNTHTHTRTHTHTHSHSLTLVCVPIRQPSAAPAAIVEPEVEDPLPDMPEESCADGGNNKSVDGSGAPLPGTPRNTSSPSQQGSIRMKCLLSCIVGANARVACLRIRTLIRLPVRSFKVVHIHILVHVHIHTHTHTHTHMAHLFGQPWIQS